MAIDEPREGSRAAGAVVLTAASCGVGLALFAYSRDAFVLLVWAIGAAALWWVARKPNKIDNPSPPLLSAPSPPEKPQFKVVSDKSNPHRSVVEWGKSQSPGGVPAPPDAAD